MSLPHGTNRSNPKVYPTDVKYSVFCEGGFNDGSLSAMAKAEDVELPWPHNSRQEVSGKLLNRMIASGGNFVDIHAVIPKSTKAKTKPKVNKKVKDDGTRRKGETKKAKRKAAAAALVKAREDAKLAEEANAVKLAAEVKAEEEKAAEAERLKAEGEGLEADKVVPDTTDEANALSADDTNEATLPEA